MSSFGQGCQLRLSASMSVPTGSAFLATRTLGPRGTAGAAAAAWAPAPANMFLAMTAVMTAMTNAPTSRATFFTSMARSPPQHGQSLRPYSSGKLVKKLLGENGETAEGDRNAVRDLRPPGPPLRPMERKQANREHSAGKGHQHQELQGGRRRKPQRQRGRELDVAAAHHARVKSRCEEREHSRAERKLDCDVRPERQCDRQPVDRRKQRNGQIQ